jgi:hypothetical protein
MVKRSTLRQWARWFEDQGCPRRMAVEMAATHVACGGVYERVTWSYGNA